MDFVEEGVTPAGLPGLAVAATPRLAGTPRVGPADGGISTGQVPLPAG